jgi:hypothetical protein
MNYPFKGFIRLVPFNSVSSLLPLLIFYRSSECNASSTAARHRSSAGSV